VFDAKLVEFELTLSDPVHEFDAGDGRRGSSKMLEAEHRTKPQLDRSMVLFNQIGGHEIEVLAAELRGLLCLVRLLPLWPFAPAGRAFSMHGPAAATADGRAKPPTSDQPSPPANDDKLARLTRAGPEL
jgi:hypothetical protein